MALPTLASLSEGINVQLDNQLVHKSLGEVNVTLKDSMLHVTATILLRPGQGNEGWQTGVAIDCSSSMTRAFGGENMYFTRALTDAETSDLISKGLIEVFEQDGQSMCRMLHGCHEHLLQQGILRISKDENEVQNVCRTAIPLLAEEIDADGGTTVLYWAMGADGSGIELMGDLTAEEAKTAEYKGVSDWGNGTKLMPAIRYFLTTFADAPMGFYVFITDGRIDDFEEVKAFTCQLSHDIAAKKVNPVHFVLVGVGSEIDTDQMAQLDDLPDAMNLPYDIWDHKIAKEMRSINDIFAELVDENRIIAKSAEIKDLEGNSVHSYTDGVPAIMRFSMPMSAKGFQIVLPNGATLQQQVIA